MFYLLTGHLWTNLLGKNLVCILKWTFKVKITHSISVALVLGNIINYSPKVNLKNLNVWHNFGIWRCTAHQFSQMSAESTSTYTDNGISIILIYWLNVSLVDHTLMIMKKFEESIFLAKSFFFLILHMKLFLLLSMTDYAVFWPKECH